MGYKDEGHNLEVALERGWTSNRTETQWRRGHSPVFTLNGGKKAWKVASPDHRPAWACADLINGRWKNHRAYGTLDELLDVETESKGGEPYYVSSGFWRAPFWALKYDYQRGEK